VRIAEREEVVKLGKRIVEKRKRGKEGIEEEGIRIAVAREKEGRRITHHPSDPFAQREWGQGERNRHWKKHAKMDGRREERREREKR